MDRFFVLKLRVKNNNGHAKKNYYYASVFQEKKNKYRINIGNYKLNPCITISLKNNSKKATIENISNDIKCTIYNNDKIKHHDIIHMVKLLINFAKNIFPHITKFYLTDNSQIKCYKNNKISLADLTFIKCGKTLFEKNLHCYPYNRRLIKIRKKDLNESINREFPFDKDEFIKMNLMFCKKYINNFFNNKKKKDNLIKIIEKNYRKNITPKNYILHLIKKNYLCSTYIFIMNQYLNKTLYGQDWIINSNEFLHKVKYSFLETNKNKNHSKINKKIKIFNDLLKNNEYEEVVFKKGTSYKNFAKK